MVKPYRGRQAPASLDSQAGSNFRARSRPKLTRALKDTTAKSTVLAKGEILDGGEQAFDKLPGEIKVKAGQFLQLSVSPLKNHGADSTLVEWEIAEVGGVERKWNLTNDVLDDLLAGNPHADKHGNKHGVVVPSTLAMAYFLYQRQFGAAVSGKPDLSRLAKRRHSLCIRQREQRICRGVD